MIKHKKRKIKYEALGFVESMIAIMIVGISSVVLMQIAVNTMQGIMQNEAIDDMTQGAIEAGEIVQELANRDKLTEEVLFPEPKEYGGLANCFVLDMVEGEIRFKKDEEENFVKFENSLERREEYKELAILNEDDDLFRFICLQLPVGSSEEDLNFVIANIIVGQRRSGGVITKGNLVKDYEYSTVIKLLGGNTLTNVTPPPVVCGDGVCGPGQTAENCPNDCSAVCGDGFCTHDEYAGSCAADCSSICGDGFCTHDETDVDCPEDCLDDGYCVQLQCTNSGIYCESHENCLYSCHDDGYCINNTEKSCITHEDCAPE